MAVTPLHFRVIDNSLQEAALRRLVRENIWFQFSPLSARSTEITVMACKGRVLDAVIDDLIGGTTSTGVPRKYVRLLTGEVDLRAIVHLLLDSGQYFQVLPCPDDTYEVAVRDDDSSRPMLDRFITELDANRELADRYRRQAHLDYGTDDCDVDDNAVVSIGEGVAFVQAWIHIDEWEIEDDVDLSIDDE